MAKPLSTSAIVVGLIVRGAAPAGATDWPVFGFDPARSSYNSAETTMTPRKRTRLHERWQIALGDVADSTPILCSTCASAALTAMLFQTTKNGVTLGIEATTGKILWQFTTRGPTLHALDAGCRSVGQGDLRSRRRRQSSQTQRPTGHESMRPGFPKRITRMPRQREGRIAAQRRQRISLCDDVGILRRRAAIRRSCRQHQFEQRQARPSSTRCAATTANYPVRHVFVATLRHLGARRRGRRSGYVDEWPHLRRDRQRAVRRQARAATTTAIRCSR